MNDLGKNSVSHRKMQRNSAHLLIKFLIDQQNINTSMIRMSSKLQSREEFSC